MTQISKWEIWNAYCAFEDEPSKGKLRPMLIVDNRTSYYISFKITSHDSRWSDDGDYEIINWRSSGLRKPSTIRISKIVNLEERDLVEKVGILHPVDRNNVQKIIKRRENQRL